MEPKITKMAYVVKRFCADLCELTLCVVLYPKSPYVVILATVQWRRQNTLCERNSDVTPNVTTNG